MMEGYEKVVQALSERGLLVPSWSEGQRARCPSHDDTNPSLSVARGDDGRALVYCHAGCAVRDVVDSLALDIGDLFAGSGSRSAPVVRQYVYVDEDNAPLFRVNRTDPKGFWQERWEDGEWKPGLRDTRRVPYRLPELLRAIAQGRTVYLVEGEKDVESIESEGEVATTLPGGAGKWQEEYAGYFRGANVIIVGDRDEADKNGRNAGSAHVSLVRLKISPVASSVGICWPREPYRDSTEHLAGGYTLAELVSDEVDLSVFAPIQWQDYAENPVEWLLEPWMPRSGRVLGFGAKGSLKSLWAMWLASRLSQEGHRTAYFSLEILPSETANRLKRLNPHPDNFKVFTKNLRLDNAQHVDQIIRGLTGYSLIVIDSWTAAHQFRGRMNPNDEVAALDNEVFIPIIEGTGASLFLLDNVGHDSLTRDGRKVKQAHARGASAKGDKMEMELWFDRPDPTNNYRVTISCAKMRLNYPWPLPVTVETPKEEIEFYLVESSGAMTSPMWPGASSRESASPADNPSESPEREDVSPSNEPLSSFDQRALARLRHHFGDVTEERATISTDSWSRHER